MTSAFMGNKYVTAHVAGKKNVLFFRNWIRSGIRKVSVVLTNAILSENHINQKLIYKQNMYAEIMTTKDRLDSLSKLNTEKYTFDLKKV